MKKNKDSIFVFLPLFLLVAFLFLSKNSRPSILNYPNNITEEEKPIIIPPSGNPNAKKLTNYSCISLNTEKNFGSEEIDSISDHQTWNNVQKTFIEDEVNPPITPVDDIAELLDAPQPPSSEPQQNKELEYIDTCGCNKMKKLHEDWVVCCQSGGMTFDQYIVQQKGLTAMPIGTALDIVFKCKKMFETGVRKDRNGNVTQTYSSGAGWSKIGKQNLNEFAHDFDIKIPGELGCNPPPICTNKMPCHKISSLFKDFLNLKANEDLGGGIKGSDALKLPTYQDPNDYLNEIFDWMIVNDKILQGNMMPTGHLLARMNFLDALKNHLNLNLNLCPNTPPYSISYFLKRLEGCKPTCQIHLDCVGLWLQFRQFTINNPIPNGYSGNGQNTARFVADFKNFYKQSKEPGADPLLIAWMNNFASHLNAVYNPVCPLNPVPMYSILHLMDGCYSWPKTPYKPEKCKTCYKTDITWINLLQTFLNEVTYKPTSSNYQDQLYQSLWYLDPNAPQFKYQSFFNTPLYSKNGVQGTHKLDLDWELLNVSVPELDVSIKDYNGFTLNFQLDFPNNNIYWNFANILSFSNIKATNIAKCAKPRFFKVDALYDVPQKYWTLNPELSCPNKFNINNDPIGCEIPVTMIGEVKKGTTQSAIEKEVPCIIRK